MPTSPARRCLKCNRLIKGQCPCSPGWQRKPDSWAGGSSRQWRVFRAGWLRDHPYCMDCGSLATVVCHLPGTNYAIDRCNPTAIEGQRCQRCDARVTAQQGRASR